MSDEYSSLIDYLTKTGVLENGNQDEILAAKKAYRRYYMRRYKREQRGNRRELTLSLPKGFFKSLSSEANRHGMTISRFVLNIVKGYVNAIPVVNHPDRFAQLELKFAQLHSELQFLGDQVFTANYQSVTSHDLFEKLIVIEDELTKASQVVSLKDFLIDLIASKRTSIEELRGIIQQIEAQKKPLE